MYLDFTENMARKHKKDWAKKLDAFLEFNEYEILEDAGRVRKNVADEIASKEYDKYRIIQDQEYESDFDSVVKHIQENQSLPKNTNIKKHQSSFQNNLRKITQAPKPEENRRSNKDKGEDNK